jgi:TrmH family RNA methyltransferase
MGIITSTQNPAIKRLRSLRYKKDRQAMGLFIAEGPRMLARAQAAGWPIDTLVAKGGESPPVFEARHVLQVSEKVMASLSAQANPPELIGIFEQRIDERFPLPASGDLWVALDTIRDPGNLGTIIRTADATAVAGIILIGQHCDPWSPECVRATMGSIFAVPLLTMEEAVFARGAAAWPGDIIATETAARTDYRRDYRNPVLLLLGSEASGLSPALSALATERVRIPMAGGAESLNIASAAAVMLYEIRRADLR